MHEALDCAQSKMLNSRSPFTNLPRHRAHVISYTVMLPCVMIQVNASYTRLRG